MVKELSGKLETQKIFFSVTPILTALYDFSYPSNRQQEESNRGDLSHTNEEWHICDHDEIPWTAQKRPNLGFSKDKTDRSQTISHNSNAQAHVIVSRFENTRYHVVSGGTTKITMEEYLEKVRKKFISTLTLLTEEEFQEGLKIFERKSREKYGKKDTENKIVYEKGYTFVVGEK